MTFFSALEVAALRAVQESAFADTCTIAVPSEASDGKSGYTHTWTNGSPIACGVSSPSQAASTGLPLMDTGSDERQMIFGLPYATEIKQGYRIAWNDRTFEIERIEEPGTYPMQITAIGLERIV